MNADEFVVPHLEAVVEKVDESNYEASAKQEFMHSADHFLVAHALAQSYIVVTEENRKSGSKKKVKIPDICDEMKIRCMKTHEMLRKEKARFILDKRGQ